MNKNEIPLGNAEDLRDKVFNKLIPLYRIPNKNGKTMWHCKCECGNECDVSASNLKSHTTKSCGCWKKERDKQGRGIINELGNIYGEWKVISLGNKIYANHAQSWICECQECGYQIDISGTHLRLKRYPHCPKCTDKLSIVGQTFGKLTVLEASEYRDINNGSILYKCQCSCGNIVYRRRKQLKDEHFSSCGCDINYKKREERKKEMIGKQIDDLLVLSLNEDQFLYGEYVWNCQCKCGNIVAKNTSTLKDKTHYHSCNDCARINHRVPLNTRIGDLEIKNYINDPNNNSLIGYKCYCYKCNNLVDLDTIKYRNITRRQGNMATCGCDSVVSYGEQKIENLLILHNINYLHDKGYFKDLIFPNTNGLCRFDFIIFNNKNEVSYIIEYDGEQHFTYNNKGWNNDETYQERKDKDLFKNQYCFDRNIPIIRIPYWHFNQLNIQDLLLETSNYILTPQTITDYYNYAI